MGRGIGGRDTHNLFYSSYKLLIPLIISSFRHFSLRKIIKQDYQPGQTTWLKIALSGMFHLQSLYLRSLFLLPKYSQEKPTTTLISRSYLIPITHLLPVPTSFYSTYAFNLFKNPKIQKFKVQQFQLLGKKFCLKASLHK